MTYPRQRRRRTLRPSKSAFSLVELLVTIGVLAVLMSASLPALLNNRRSSELTQAGNLVADAVSLARQTALSKNTFVTIVVTKAAPPARQAVGLLEYDGTTEQWKQMGGWIRLPASASVTDMNQALGNSKADGIARLDRLRLEGRTLAPTDYSTLLFYPDGRMENGTAQTRQLSARYSTDSASASSGSLQNYYDVVVNASTSAFRVSRP